MPTDSDRRIDYIEIPVTDVSGAKRFYGAAFGWTFTDYGPEYASFSDGRTSGGFQQEKSVAAGGPLLVLYAADLEAIEETIRRAGGKIVKPTFPFPGGRRFHFSDPSGNELAVWSE